MTGDIENPGDETQEEESSSTEDTFVESISDEDIELNMQDEVSEGSTVEVNVEKLVAKIEAADPEEAARQREVRLKVEALNEQRDDELGSTYNFNIDDDV